MPVIPIVLGGGWTGLEASLGKENLSQEKEKGGKEVEEEGKKKGGEKKTRRDKAWTVPIFPSYFLSPQMVGTICGIGQNSQGSSTAGNQGTS